MRQGLKEFLCESLNFIVMSSTCGTFKKVKMSISWNIFLAFLFLKFDRWDFISVLFNKSKVFIVILKTAFVTIILKNRAVYVISDL